MKCSISEAVGHASCQVISLAHARTRSLDLATFIHQDSLLAKFVLWSTVLQSKRVDFEYGVFSAVFTGQTCMSRVIICYLVLSRIGLYISETMDCNCL